jgi:ABC-type dipeptide/oligopeptide/nickel transport system permease subunit
MTWDATTFALIASALVGLACGYVIGRIDSDA